MVALLAFAVLASTVGVVIAVAFIGPRQRDRAGWGFAGGTLIGLVISGVSFGHLISDSYKKPAWGLWLGI